MKHRSTSSSRALVLLTALLLCIPAFAQKVDPKAVPAPVMNKFNIFFPKMKKVKWEKEGDCYEANFKDAKKAQTSVLLTAEGNIKEVETCIKQSALPKKINDTIPKLFAGYKFEEACRIDASGLITYEVEMEKGKETIEVIFSEAAAVMSKKVEMEGAEKKKN